MPRILQQHTFGGPENLSLDDLPSALPGPGEVRLRVQAIGLTIDQLPFLAGNDYGNRTSPSLPTRFGYEVAGIVEEIGEGVDSAWLGKTVAPIGPFDQAKYGCAGEEGIVPAALLSAYPDTITPAQAAALWVPYLTAYAIVSKGKIAAGDYIAITAGNSAVSLAAIQIARDAGAYPIVAVRKDTYVDDLRAIGAQEVIVTHSDDYVARMKEITGGPGPRITFDAIGGDFITTACAAAASGGVVIAYGVLDGMNGRFPAELVIGKGLAVHGYTVAEITNNPEQRDIAVRYILDRVATGQLSPRVAQTFALQDVHNAYDFVQSGGHLGRTVLLTESAW